MVQLCTSHFVLHTCKPIFAGMERKTLMRAFLPVLLVFIISSALVVSIGNTMEERWNIDKDVVLIGNLVLFLATAISFFLYQKSLTNNRVQVFLRMIYSGMFIKMFICLITAFIYISSAGKSVSKGAVFVCMFLYFVYSFIEIAVLLKLSKQHKNA
jgi:hypothetical protein